ncbi:MAG: TIGR01777 family oxidoreductase [Bacteroidota bacterium]
MERVLITGGTGVIGSRLQMHLAQAGYYSVILTRDETKSRADKAHAHWDVNQGQIDDHALEVDHVINLVGAGIAEKKWTSSRKKVLFDSRVNTTTFLINQFRKRRSNLQSFISASAIGYYGDGGDQVLTEDTGIVTQEFLSDVCEAWEAAAAPAEDISNRLVIYRISTVLSKGSGALAKMDATIPFGVANYLGSGEQYFSWIHIDDLCRAIVHAL